MKRIGGLVGLCGLAALIAAGCGTQKHSLLLPNQAPEVELFAQQVSQSTTGPVTYQLRWVGRDPDGRVDHFLCSVGSPADDPRAAAWTATAARERALSFPARTSAEIRALRGAIEPSVFSVRAVDAVGAMSAPAQMAFFEGALAPRVQILSPRPNSLIRYYLGPTVCVEWAGTAFDNDTTAEGVAEYKYKVLTETTEVSVRTARSFPDSIRRYYAPRNWEGWVSTRGRATSAVLNLTPDREYVFAITCFDDDGNYDPVFSLDKNMLYIRSISALNFLPTITLFNSFIHYTSPPGPLVTVMTVEVPAGQPITFNWYATAAERRHITGYRWALDLVQRGGEERDEGERNQRDRDREEGLGGEGSRLGRWSPWRLTTTSATVGPFNPLESQPETHTLYVEARDRSGCEEDPSGTRRLVLRLSVVRPTFDRELLIVDDTRLALDRVVPGTACSDPQNRPLGAWPTQAELDTFLYAVGGKPWRCYPAGSMSTPGIFNGYSFDTLGTNLRVHDLTVPLSKLSQYRHVIWLTDHGAAGNRGDGSDPGSPRTAMRFMNDQGHANTIAAYVRQGGLVWLAGGGAACAALIEFNVPANDITLPIPRTTTFSFERNELVPGRFIYDQAHWRREFKWYTITNGRILRSLGRFESNPGIYLGLPAEMQAKTPATDPFPPNRTLNADFYRTDFEIEFLSDRNEIFEDQDPRPNHEHFQSTLDTLYEASASSLTNQVNAVMTYYHGADNAPFILTGFDLWHYRRSQCVQLVDFVLQRLWGMTRQGPVLAPNVVGSAKSASVGKLVRPNASAAPSVARHD